MVRLVGRMFFRASALWAFSCSNEAIAFKVGGSAFDALAVQAKEQTWAKGAQAGEKEAEGDVAYSQAEKEAQRIIAAVDNCLGDRMVAADMDDWKLERLNKVRRAEIVTRLVQAKISLREFGEQWTDDVPTIEAVKMTGREAAEEIAHKEFEETIHKTLSGSNLSQAAVEEFATKMTQMAEMCGDGEEGQKLAQDELKLLKGNTNMSAMESTMAHELAVYVEEKCQLQVMDVDFFVARLGGHSDCNELIGTSLLSKMRKEAQKLDYYAKTTLVLHNEENGVGHHFVKLLRGEGHSESSTNVASFKAMLHNATQQSMEHLPTMSRLRMLDLKHFHHVHGYTVEKYCHGNVETKPAQWILDSPAIQKYVDCLCIRQQPSLLCDAQHSEELETIRPEVMAHLTAAKHTLNEAVLLQLAESFKSKGAVGLGPCADGGFSCNFCVSGQCMDHTGAVSMDHLNALSSMLKGPSGCVSGDCSLCLGLKPGDPLMFVLSFGIALQECNNQAAMFTSFHIWAGIQLCIGGLLGKIADAIGWGSCVSLAHVAYYPFINKMLISLALPVFVPPPLGLSAGLQVNLNMGDLTPAVYNYCEGLGHGQFNCLKSMFDARGTTGVSMGVDVLIGVQIPILGTVGKWVRILGFEVAEKDRSRELAMNKAGVTVEYIGKNPHRGPYCGKTFSNVNCLSYAGDQGYRANTQDNHKGDRFNIYRNPQDPHDPRAICVRRVDHWDASWGMELEIACKVDNNQNGGGGVLVPLGTTHHDTKCVMPPEPVHCTGHAGNRGYRLGFDSHEADFSITQMGDRVCGHLLHRRRRRRRHRRRRRNSNGWDMNLVVECEPTGHAIDYVIQDINIGTSKTDYKCILPTHRLECDHDAGNHHKRANDNKNGDSFTIWTSHTNHLCARRTDSRSGWGMDLKIQCKQREQLWGKQLVHIGASHHNEKCVPAPSNSLHCDDLAANRHHRFTGTDKPDDIYVFHRNGNICVRRTDHHAGWGLNLEIDCKVLLGPFLFVNIGPSYSNYRCVLTTHRVECDWDAANSNKRVNPTINHDQFVVWTSHTNHVCARRTDAHAGWGMDLKIRCRKFQELWDVKKVTIPPSQTNEKCYPSPGNKVKCDYLAADQEHRFNWLNSPDKFHIEHRNNQMCVRRLDWAGGWGGSLEIECKVLHGNNEHVYIGASKHALYRCVLPTHRMECARDAADKYKRVNSYSDAGADKFTVWESHTHHICARRADANAGWEMGLEIQCKQFEQRWNKMRVTIPPSHTNEKCFSPPNPKVRCDDLAADRQHRLNWLHTHGRYTIAHRHGKICVRRLDQRTGWGGSIEIECKVLF